MVNFDGDIEAIGGSRLARVGSDAAIVSWGAMVPAACEAADKLKTEGVEVAVLDLRWLSPLDEKAILSLTSAVGGRVIIAHEANVTGGFGAEVACRIYSATQMGTTPQVVRVGTPDARIPAAPVLQRSLIPDANRLMQELQKLLA